MNAYRPEPAVGQASAPLLWRPWMTRLATVVGVAASPIGCVYGIVRICEAYPGSADVPVLVAVAFVLMMLQCAAIAVVGIVTCIHDDIGRKISSSFMLRIAWASIVYPCIGIARLAKWVAYGDT